MSPVMDNFVHSLVEMAKAMEELPQVQAELERTKTDKDNYITMVQAREESILRHKAEIEALQARVRDAEASRDDAELRFLELDEKAGKVLRVLAAVQSDATAATELLSPKPEPVPEPTPEPVYPWNTVQPQADPSPTQPATESVSYPETYPKDWDKPPVHSEAPRPYDYYDAQGRGQYWVRNEVGQFAPVQREVDPTQASNESVSQAGQSVQDPSTTAQTGQSDPLPSASPAPSTNTESPTTASLPVAESQASAPVDDVGYHNEPARYSSDWYRWADRMDSRYGFSKWPTQDVAQ